MNEWTIQFQYTRVLALISWTGLNEITESDALGKGCTSHQSGYCLWLFYILSFILVSPPGPRKKEAQGSEYNACFLVPHTVASSCGYIVRVEKINALINVVYIQFPRAFLYIIKVFSLIKVFSAEGSRVCNTCAAFQVTSLTFCQINS